jgi:hypothetical protein
LVEAYDRALNKGDAQAIADLFAVTAMMLPPDEARIDGKEALYSRHKKLFDQATLQHALSAHNLIISDTLAGCSTPFLRFWRIPGLKITRNQLRRKLWHWLCFQSFTDWSATRSGTCR